jgi:hypothetical protein
MFTLEGREIVGLTTYNVSSFGSDLPSQSDGILQGFENVQKLDKTARKKLTNNEFKTPCLGHLYVYLNSNCNWLRQSRYSHLQYHQWWVGKNRII